MAVEFLQTINEAITTYTRLTFFTILIASVITLYFIISHLFGPSSNHHQQKHPLPPPVQLGAISQEELKTYDGTDPQKPLLLAIKGQIYDVSQSREFFGPGGPYAPFAGKDASRGLAKISFKEEDLNDDLTGLRPLELDALQDWEYQFMRKFVKVGTIKTPEGAPEASTAGEPIESTATEYTEPTAAESSMADVLPAEPCMGVVHAAEPFMAAAVLPAEPCMGVVHAAEPSMAAAVLPAEPCMGVVHAAEPSKSDVHVAEPTEAKEEKEETSTMVEAGKDD